MGGQKRKLTKIKALNLALFDKSITNIGKKINRTIKNMFEFTLFLRSIFFLIQNMFEFISFK